MSAVGGRISHITSATRSSSAADAHHLLTERLKSLDFGAAASKDAFNKASFGTGTAAAARPLSVEIPSCISPPSVCVEAVAGFRHGTKERFERFGTQFTCFTRTYVQILTHEELQNPSRLRHLSVSATVSLPHRLLATAGSPTGAHSTCFTCTKVQILTQTALIYA